jgi:outer membrane protein assembly factor BamB
MSRWPVGVGVGVVVVLAIGGVWRWSASGGGAAPEPAPLTCADDGLTSQLDDGGDALAFPSALPAAREAPVESGRIRGGPPDFDYRPPYSPDGLGYRLDPEAGTVSYTSGADEPGAAVWTATISDVPLDELDTGVSGFPGRRDLLVVSARQREEGVPLLVVLDTDGTVRLSCSVGSGGGEGMIGASSLTPDGSVLFLPDIDEDENAWISAHSTQNGEHLWSVPGAAWDSDEDRAYVADGFRITAYDLETGEESWTRDVDWNFDDATTGVHTDDGEPDDWELAAVGDELYAHPRGARRLVTLDIRTGRTTWDLTPGDTETNRLRVTALDLDGRVMLNFGQDVAVRVPVGDNWSWLHRGTEFLAPPAVLTRSGEPTVVVFGSNDPNSELPLTISTDSGERLVTIPYRGRDNSYAVADTMVYVLSKADGTVTGYDLESAEELWAVRVPAGEGSAPRGLRAIDGGFDVVLDDGTSVRYRGASS